MAILVDSARWRHRGRMWSHMVSDVGLEELHAFAAALGVPRRGFDRDHYDVPAEVRERALASGARAVASRDLIVALRALGLRPRRRG